jgi:hypothetical protein
MLDDDLFHDCLSELWLKDDMQALVRLVVSYRQLYEGSIVDFSFDASVDPADYQLSGGGGWDATPTSIVFGPKAFAHGLPPSMEHTVARAYEEAGLRMQRKSGYAASFLAFKADMLSQGLTEEVFGFFASKAVQALDDWRHLEPDEKVAVDADLDLLTKKVEERFMRADAAEQQSYDGIRQDWRKVARPY